MPGACLQLGDSVCKWLEIEGHRELLSGRLSLTGRIRSVSRMQRRPLCGAVGDGGFAGDGLSLLFMDVGVLQVCNPFKY